MKKNIKTLTMAMVCIAMALCVSCKKNDVSSNDNNGGGGNDPSNPTVVTNGYEYVDLGLPSGTLWAKYNVGASTPTDYGKYFAWGEVSSKSSYKETNYKWWTVNDDGAYNITKYNYDYQYGNTDNIYTLELSDDAAYKNWGGSWRMPTLKQMQELIDECYWEYNESNGKGYMKVTGPNEKSIVLPSAGEYADVQYLGGHYWCSSLDTFYADCADCLNFGTYWPSMSAELRYAGMTIRPVCSSK